MRCTDFRKVYIAISMIYIDQYQKLFIKKIILVNAFLDAECKLLGLMLAVFLSW